jgi:hypothetical protein
VRPLRNRAMLDPKRYRLFHGPYTAPKSRIGGTLYCQYRRRELKVGNLTDALIPWPVSRQPGPRSLILCGGLVEAVRCESESAVAAHWGVAPETVWRWRTALGVPFFNEGTRRLYRDTIPEKVNLQTLAEARKASRSPEARAKLSASKKGLPPHPVFRAAATAAARRPKTEAFKQLTSRRVRREWAQGRRRGHPCGRRWSDAEVARVGTDTDEAIAQALGRSPSAVQKIRLRLAIPSFVRPTGTRE